MSSVFKSPMFFSKKVGSYSDGWGEIVNQSRDWEDAYRNRWGHDKVVRSTHGGELYGLLQLERFCQERDCGLGESGNGLSAHSPGAFRIMNREAVPGGASYSWYLYSGIENQESVNSFGTSECMG